MKEEIILIPGTWARARSWGGFITSLEEIGFKVHAPEKRYHDLSYEEIEEKIGEVSINDYVLDFVSYIQKLDNPDVFILGHSLGGLIAQLVAEKIDHKGLILLGPAPSSDIFAFYPTMVHAFYKHFLQWGFWKKPLYPNKYAYYNYVANMQDDKTIDEAFNDLVPESGRVYTEMSLPIFDRNKSTRVDHENIGGPVLVITGSEDNIVVPAIARNTAKNYQNSKFLMIEGSDHLYTSKRVRSRTISEISRWIKEEFK